jgi:hypothetical protein
VVVGNKISVITILLRITRLWARNLTEKRLFHWELPTRGCGIHSRNSSSLGIIIFWAEESNIGIVIAPGIANPCDDESTGEMAF